MGRFWGCKMFVLKAQKGTGGRVILKAEVVGCICPFSKKEKTKKLKKKRKRFLRLLIIFRQFLSRVIIGLIFLRILQKFEMPFFFKSLLFVSRVRTCTCVCIRVRVIHHVYTNIYIILNSYTYL